MTGTWIEIDAPRLATVRRMPLRATFIERPHRFAARCRLRGGREAEAHVPNPGRLTGVLAPGCQVLLDGPYPETRALAYTMVAARAVGAWVGTNTLYANRVFPALLSHGLFPEFDRTSSTTCATRLDDATRTDRGTAALLIRAEVVHGHSRFDFQVGGMMVEVKSVTLAGGAPGCSPTPSAPARPVTATNWPRSPPPAIPPPSSSWRSGATSNRWRRKTRSIPRSALRFGARRTPACWCSRARSTSPRQAPRGPVGCPCCSATCSLNISSLELLQECRHRQRVDPVFRAKWPLAEEDENPA